jgi:protein-serine/threonine kinase
MSQSGAAAKAPTLATSPFKECPRPDEFVRRDSRVVEYHLPIPEEDESVGTASEPAEPVTPDSASFSTPSKHDDAVEGRKKGMEQKLLPTSAHAAHSSSLPAAEQPPAPVSRTNSNLKLAPPSETLEKPGLGKRVGSFVRQKLHRSTSHKDGPNGAPAQMLSEKVLVKTGVDGPTEVSTPAVNIPKYRRMSSFSLSARTSVRSSQHNSPPSPSSPTSTISEDTMTPQRKASFGHRHSTSSTGLSAMSKSGPGITWAGTNTDVKRSLFSRRRSVSTETVAQAPSDNRTVGLIDTFSKPANEGVGLKARRLSLSLPDEFVVDSCDLEKEFKSSSLMPGKKGKVLGRGATAVVHIMARRGTNGHEELVAVKEFRGREKEEDEGEYVKKIQSEYSIAKSLHHPNIVGTVRLCTNKGRWNHVMEFCAHGELFSLVERKLFGGGQENFYTLDDRLCFFKQLLRGVAYLHAHGIAHRDIKLENLLLDKEGHLKISDFGVAEVFSGEHPGLRAAGGECGKNMGELRLSKPGICGSLPYIAPEVLEKKGDYDPRPLDVWSCAIVYLTMTFGGSPWQAAKPEYEYYAKFKKGWDDWLVMHPDGQITNSADGHPKCGKIFSVISPPPLKRLLMRMLHPQPDKRITIQEVMNTNCIKNIDCCCPDSYDDPARVIDTSKASANAVKTRQYLHHHIPPKPDKKYITAFQHRFDMGDGW